MAKTLIISMETSVNEISINGVEYVRKDAVKNSVPAVNTNGLKYVIVRSRDAGVFAGYLKSREGESVVLTNARRLWYWSGAASLSQLSQEGVTDPSNCRFPCEVPEHEVLGVCEILYCTEKARECIKKVAIWKR